MYVLRDPHTFSLPAQFITCDVMSERLTEETVQFSQGFTPPVDLCKSLYFSPINCTVSPVNRTVLSVRTRPSSIPYRNEEKKRSFFLSLTDKQSSIQFSKRVAQCLQQAGFSYLFRSIVIQRQPSSTKLRRNRAGKV